VIELLIALLLEFLTDKRGPLLEGMGDAQFQYIFGLICALSAILSAFLSIKKKRLHPIIRMAILIGGVNMILLDYYFFYDTNLLYFLPVLAIAYLFIWPATED
jgi:hypothetical protein